MSGSLASPEDYDALSIPDMTSDEGNAAILCRLKNDDPSFDYVSVLEGTDDRSDNEFAIEDARSMGVLGYYLGRCTNVTRLFMLLPEDLDSGIIEPLFVGLGSNRSIRKLKLRPMHDSHLPHHFFRMLTPFIRDNPNLMLFDVCGIEMDAEQYRSLSLALREGSSLKYYTIGGLVDGGQYDHEQSIIANIEALKMHSRLEYLFFRDFAMGRNVCAAISDLLRQSDGMQKLCLLNSSIDDAGVEALADGLAHCRGLKELNLAGNPAVSVRGWRALSAVLEDSNSSLEKLSLRECGINDESATIFANALANNCTLTAIQLFDFDTDNTGKGWEAFSKVLCDTSSVNSTFLSNHTLWNLSGPGSDDSSLPDDLSSFLHLNEEDDKKRVATEKILLTHDDFNMQPLFEWDLKVLPFVIQWFERAAAYGMAGTGYAILFEDEARISERKLSAIYQFVRGMPELAVEGILGGNEQSAKTGGEKRLHSAAFGGGGEGL